ncbi:hypothetical protein O7605_16830 [Verrucosispora sp. WMMA2121]|uniref:hypothetical protein n=1 Tax=Verrucosispora sp. WMMA2121 TaxID=3015164 RepID=UPI0022B63E44|nr:hypothetical protein [Verrucosispora sp. WMMA2121]MCZ7421170.1 hypothetical protein [Verrucosispora sp. WMMA2121]
MRYGTDDEHPFDTDNRAWRRLRDVTSEHFDAITCNRDPDGRPVLLTLRDMRTGDTVTLAVLDSLEIRDPHTLLAVHTSGDLGAHGPTSGAEAAHSHAATLALNSTTERERGAFRRLAAQYGQPSTAPCSAGRSRDSRRQERAVGPPAAEAAGHRGRQRERELRRSMSAIIGRWQISGHGKVAHEQGAGRKAAGQPWNNDP